MANTRRQAREWVVQMLFALEQGRPKIDEMFTDFWAEHEAAPEGRSFAETHVRGVVEHLTEIDAKINENAKNWEMHRMGTVERSVLRMALYELLYRPDIPPVVSINEAVDLAKYFSDQDAGKFVNGILDPVRKTLTRPARRAVT